MTKYLEENKFYMNVHTGSVAVAQEWEKDFEDREDKEQSWEEWEGGSLIEVIEKDDKWQGAVFRCDFDLSAKEKAVKMLEEYEDWNQIMSLADDNICEYLHNLYAPCDEKTFLEKYIELHRNKFNEDYEI